MANKNLTNVDDPSLAIDNGSGLSTRIVNNESKTIKEKMTKGNGFKIIHIVNISIDCNYETLYQVFKKYGTILCIQMNLEDDHDKWESWITFENHEAALKACCDLEEIKIDNLNINGALCDTAPSNLEVYKPSDWFDNDCKVNKIQRKPKPPMWLIVTAETDNFNYFKFTKYIRTKVGTIGPGDISQFGKKSVLVHARTVIKSTLISRLKTKEGEMKVSIKPHLNFSYGRGVIFNKDLYDFSEEEILDMCPDKVWKVSKVPRTSMIVLTFNDNEVPSHLFIENERIPIRLFKQKPLQCYNCYGFGHPSRVCKNTKLCNVCAEPEHGICSAEPKCLNCSQNHKSNDHRCEMYKNEEAAINKSLVEHISVGYAKRLLNKTRSYAGAAKANLPNKKSTTTLPVPKRVSGINPPVNPSHPTTISSPISQAISLPDLDELPESNIGKAPGNSSSINRKRERLPSHSPPSRNIRISLGNPFEPLSCDDNIVVNAEIHHTPRHLVKKDSVRKPKPNIHRNVHALKPAKKQNSKSVDKKTPHKGSSSK